MQNLQPPFWKIHITPPPPLPPCNMAHIITPPYVIRIRLLHLWEIWLVVFRIYHICKIKHILSKYMIIYVILLCYILDYDICFHFQNNVKNSCSYLTANSITSVWILEYSKYKWIVGYFSTYVLFCKFLKPCDWIDMNFHFSRFMICCDHCENWYHGKCVGISRARGKEMDENKEEYICDACKGN